MGGLRPPFPLPRQSHLRAPIGAIIIIIIVCLLLLWSWFNDTTVFYILGSSTCNFYNYRGLEVQSAPINFCCINCIKLTFWGSYKRNDTSAMAILDDSVLPVHNSKSEPPPLFDGTTRLYISFICPYAQRVWIARNYKGLQDIQILPIDLQDRPAWYKEKVYPPNKVPSLEHNGKVTGESLDLLEYLENHFEGPPLKPTDPVKKQAADELLKYTDTFTKVGFTALAKQESDAGQEVGPALDYLENALSKFSAEGPFFLGQFSLVDIAYAPFIERFQIVFAGLKNYDIAAGRPKLSKWIEEINKFDAYTKTKVAPEEILEVYKRRLANNQK